MDDLTDAAAATVAAAADAAAATGAKVEAAAADDDLEVRGGVLSLAGRDLAEVPATLGERFGAHVTTLSLSFNQLRALDHLQAFVNLTTLEVDNNDLVDVSALPKMPALHTFSANNNSLDDIDQLLELFKLKFPGLHYLSLLKNPACPHAIAGGGDDEYRRYRHRVIYNLPTLKFLDSQPVTAAERKEAMRVGPFLRVARPTSETIKTPPVAKTAEEPQPEYRPLPAGLTPTGEHTSSFGQCKYVYYGRHSEGNRFIRNDAL
eukprot:Unigene7246_Nuclearia_a/m.22245 Unigene7246_Nuclearia_a/g.22245  ORF Unigene7246_Nuclearia_a/g.22245 Unigene7246_Nuclearia_a/m.22245 type:complete len:262 (-) Unigene7246_Nuclearia_a:73-858(-)